MTEEKRPLTPKDRMAIPRQKMPEQKPKVRAKNFDEVPFGYDDETAIKEAQRCLACANPKCVHGCPVGVQVREVVD